MRRPSFTTTAPTYQGPLTLVERLQGMACNVPLLVAAATLCWVTWSPVLGGGGGR